MFDYTYSTSCFSLSVGFLRSLHFIRVSPLPQALFFRYTGSAICAYPIPPVFIRGKCRYRQRMPWLRRSARAIFCAHLSSACMIFECSALASAACASGKYTSLMRSCSNSSNTSLGAANFALGTAEAPDATIFILGAAATLPTEVFFTAGLRLRFGLLAVALINLLKILEVKQAQ